MAIQQVSFQDNLIVKQNQQHNVAVSPVVTSSTGDTVEISTKKKENKALKYTLIGVGVLLGIVAIVKHKSIAKLFEKAPEDKPDVKRAQKETPKITGTTSSHSTSDYSNSPCQNTSNIQAFSSKPKQKVKMTPTVAETIEIRAFKGIDNPLQYILNANNEELLQEFKDVFPKLKELEGKDFIEKAYDLIAKKLGYEGCAPKLKIEPFDQEGYYFDGIDGVIAVNEKNISTKTNAENLHGLLHEFMHFIQASDIIRTEGLGSEIYIKSKPTSFLRQARYDKQLCIASFGKENLSVEEEQSYVQKEINEYKKAFNNSLYDKVVKMKGIIKSNNDLAKQSKNYLYDFNDVMYPYTREQLKEMGYNMNKYSVGLHHDIYNRYQNNLVELHANTVGQKIEDSYNAFLKGNS